MDFVSDQLFDEESFRTLTVADCHRREALPTVPRVSLQAYQVVDALDDLVRARDRPDACGSTMARGVPDAGPMGLPERRRAGRLPARHAHRQRHH